MFPISYVNYQSIFSHTPNNKFEDIENWFTFPHAQLELIKLLFCDVEVRLLEVDRRTHDTRLWFMLMLSWVNCLNCLCLMFDVCRTQFSFTCLLPSPFLSRFPKPNTFKCAREEFEIHKKRTWEAEQWGSRAMKYLLDSSSSYYDIFSAK